MKYSEIKRGNIYYADLEPKRNFEFGDKHLCIVLRKGHDKQTVTIISLTSKESGLGTNKIDLGMLPSLPKRLNHKQGKPINSYAALDQVRTVAASRILKIKNGKDADGSDIFAECPLDPSIFAELIYEVTNWQIANLNNEDAVGQYHKAYFFNYCVKKLIDSAYAVIKGGGDHAEQQVKYFYTNAKAIDDTFSIGDYLNADNIAHGIEEKVKSIVLIATE